MKIWKFIKGNIFARNALLAISILLVLVIVLLFSLGLYTRHGEEVVVPDVKGLSIEQAIPFFEKNSLRCEVIDSVYDPHSKPGSIVETNPHAGEKVKKNRNVYVKINSLTVETVAVPDVKDLSQRQALSMLEAVGLQNVTVEFVSGAYRDLVVGLAYRGKTLSGGDRVPINGRFVLLISSGTPEAVPDSVQEVSPNESWY